MNPIIRYEQINQMGEGGRPRVDLLALAELLNRAAVELDWLASRLQAGGLLPPEPRETEKAVIEALRAVRSVRTRRKRRVPCDRYRR